VTASLFPTVSWRDSVAHLWAQGLHAFKTTRAANEAIQQTKAEL